MEENRIRAVFYQNDSVRSLQKYLNKMEISFQMRKQSDVLMAWTVVVVLSFLGSLRSAHGDELLDQGLATMAKEIKTFLEEEKLPSKVIVGDFSGVPKLKASGGVEISRSIKSQLEAAGITVNDDADTQIMGKFKLVEKRQHPQDEFDSLALEILALVLDGNGNELAELPISVFGSVVLQISGASGVDIPQTMPEKQRQERMREQVKNPPTSTDQGKTKPTATSPFGIEILVVKGNQLEKRPATLDQQKRANVDLHQGEEYVVRLHNTANFEAAVTLTIDGVDMFVDATDAPRNSRIIVAPGKYADVPGWYISKTSTKAFQIGGYEQSVAKRVGNSTGIGTITAAFRASWDPNGKRPDDEPAGAPKGGKATTQGRDLAKNYELVTRDFGDVRALVSVRYDR